MVNMLSILDFAGTGNGTTRPANRRVNKGSKRISKKSQASKNKPVKNQGLDIAELKWIQQWLTARRALVIASLAAIPGLMFMLADEVVLPVEKITLTGHYQQLDMSSMDKQLKLYLGKGFFSLNIKKIQQQLSVEPWIKTVSVKRIWPAQLQVDIQQKQAVARWDNEHLISRNGVIFKAQADNQEFQYLPRINGYAGQSKELLQRFGQLQQEFSMHGISLAEMKEDSKGALTLLINKGLKLRIGSENNEVKIRHLLAVYPQQIKPRIKQIKYIDFRYSNGFAIAWKDEYLNQEMSGDKKKRGNKNV